MFADSGGKNQAVFESTPSPPIEVAAAVFRRNGNYLIARRFAHTHCGDLWEFPGGKKRPGESLKDCLRREILEELGVRIAVGRKIETIEHDYPERSVRLHFFACRIVSGEPRALGCSDVRWVPAEQLQDYPFPEADQRLLLMLGR